MDSDGREVALSKEFIQFSRTNGALDEDDDLVELKLVKELVKFAVLLTFLKLDVVLLQTVQRQLGVLIDEVLCRVLHELSADRLDLIRESCGEHHHLLLHRSGAEDLLDITSHVLEVVSRCGTKTI